MKELSFRLPFDASRETVDIFQGQHGPYSHYDLRKRHGIRLDMSYAIDFALPYGTSVLAARGGEVDGLMQQSQECYEGLDPQVGLFLKFGTNFVRVRHEDGTIALYSHLAHQGILVATGEIVEAGQPIAETGPSGWVGPTPHLHFHVGRLDEARIFSTIPICFRGYDGPLDHDEYQSAVRFFNPNLWLSKIPTSL